MISSLVLRLGRQVDDGRAVRRDEVAGSGRLHIGRGHGRVLSERRVRASGISLQESRAKQVLAEARDEDLVEFTSVAGLPARAVMTPWLRKYLKAEPRLQAVAQLKQRCTMAFDCLAQCGLRDGLKGWGQFCIDQRLAAGLRGDLEKGLFFRGKGMLPFGAGIASVRQLVERLLTPGVALGTPATTA